MSSVGSARTSAVRPGPAPVSVAADTLPHGLRGLLAIAFLGPTRGTVTGYLIGIVCIGAWITCLVTGAPLVIVLLTALVILPVGLLVVPVVGVLGSQRLPLDYRHLGARLHLRLWLHGRRLRTWPLPAGALADPALRRHAILIGQRAGRMASLARGARAAVAVELARALRDVEDPSVAAVHIDEVLTRVMRWEETAAGMPPVGAKLYLHHDPRSARAAAVRKSAARLGVPSDRLNYFWPGQVLLLPPARSHRSLATLIDALLAVGVADPGRPLPLQITVQGALGDEAKLIALVQLLASGLDLGIQGPERHGDEGNLIARGRRPPETVAGNPGWERTDFLFSLVWATVPPLAAAGYADQHHRDLRVVQALAAALLAARGPGTAPGVWEARLAAVWAAFARDLTQLCTVWGVAAAVRPRYLDVPFAVVQPGLEQLLATKADTPALVAGARRLRDQALALVEFTLAVARLTEAGRVRWVRVGWAGGAGALDLHVRGGLRRVRRAIRAGANVALLTRAGDTMIVLLDRPAAGPDKGGDADDHPHGATT